jgi:hypothetical protein
VQLPFLQGNKELNDRDDDYVLIISLNSSNSSSSIEAYTPISSLNSSTLSQVYLSACDPADISIHNKINSLGSKSKKHVNLFSNVFLLTPLESMPKLNPNPPSTFTPTDRYTLEQ